MRCSCCTLRSFRLVLCVAMAGGVGTASAQTVTLCHVPPGDPLSGLGRWQRGSSCPAELSPGARMVEEVHQCPSSIESRSIPR